MRPVPLPTPGLVIEPAFQFIQFAFRVEETGAGFGNVAGAESLIGHVHKKGHALVAGNQLAADTQTILLVLLAESFHALIDGVNPGAHQVPLMIQLVGFSVPGARPFKALLIRLWYVP